MKRTVLLFLCLYTLFAFSTEGFAIQWGNENFFHTEEYIYINENYTYADILTRKYEAQLSYNSLYHYDVRTDKGMMLFITDSIKSGYKVIDEHTLESVYTFIVRYDVDCSGSITSSDARLTLRASVGLEKLDTLQFKAADSDFSGTITADDARSILRYSVKLPVGGDKTAYWNDYLYLSTVCATVPSNQVKLLDGYKNSELIKDIHIISTGINEKTVLIELNESGTKNKETVKNMLLSSDVDISFNESALL